jgi:hypothetical protein
MAGSIGHAFLTATANTVERTVELAEPGTPTTERRRHRPMSTGRSWQDIKAEAHRRHPELADPERQAKVRAELDAYVSGHYLSELRKLS